MRIEHDFEISLALSHNRNNSKRWRNVNWDWSKFVTKASETVRTAETYNVYLGLQKDRQAEIKDVGGYVAGYLQGGERSNRSVTWRSMLTLDIDFDDGTMWDMFTLSFGCAALIYGTHKYHPKSPRTRLVIPLSRTVTADEYEAIGRWIAGELGINAFDDTTFQPARLMFWPSTPKDIDFYFRFQDSEPLNVEQILDSYHDWADVSEWCFSERVQKRIHNRTQDQQDPREKEGIIGAFCRSYSVSGAIEKFLPDEYSVVSDDRYTYQGGSTSGGLVVYDDLFSYSHHGTDPTSGQLCNAFDLVRLHKFGDSDDKNSDKPTHKLQSFDQMLDFASRDEMVKKEGIKARIGSRVPDASEDFGAVDELAKEPDDLEWVDQMDTVKKTGKPKSTIHNIVLILSNDVSLKGAFRYNEFENCIYVCRPMAWDKQSGRRLNNTDLAAIRHYFELKYEIVSTPKINDGIDLAAKIDKYHPVKSYLEPLVWDGKARLDTLLIDYLGCEDSTYTRLATRKTFSAAVNRVYRPGCKFDYVLVVKGGQGEKKSTIFDKMGGEWFSDSLHSFEGKAASEQLVGVWLMEISELSALRNSDAERVKHFVTQRKDRYRPAYGRLNEEYPRQCIFVGTTNKNDFLRDPTGNRRFWPMQTDPLNVKLSVDVDLTSEYIKQVWAEAKDKYKDGELLYFDSKLERQAKEQQAKYTIKDERIGLVEDYLSTKVPENFESWSLIDRRAFFTYDEVDIRPEGTVLREKTAAIIIWEELFCRSALELTRKEAVAINDMLTQLDAWSPKLFRSKSYGSVKGYELTS